MVELVVAVLILGIIIVPISTSFIVGLATTERAAQRTTDTSDQQLLASYFVNDVQSADTVSTGTAGCSQSNAVVLLTWTEPVNPIVKTAVYVRTTDDELLRVYCDSTGVTTTVKVVNALAAAPVVQCDLAACATALPGGKPKAVSMAVVAVGTKSGPSYETYNFTLSATRRVTA